jgi:hypothetical protein
VTAPVETSTRRERTVIYWTAVALLAVGVVVALLTWRENRETAEASDKAAQLTAALADAGAERVPPPERIAAVLGTDGGIVCADPGSALANAALFAGLSTASGGTGQRVGIASSDAVQAELLVVEVYCPDALDDLQAAIDDLRLEPAGD